MAIMLLDENTSNTNNINSDIYELEDDTRLNSIINQVHTGYSCIIS
jgi:hypothetical protein